MVLSMDQGLVPYFYPIFGVMEMRSLYYSVVGTCTALDPVIIMKMQE